MTNEYADLYVGYPYRRCAHVIMSGPVAAPLDVVVRVAVETETGWDLLLQRPHSVHWFENPFSCQAHPIPQVCEASARAYIENGDVPPEMADVLRNTPALIEREALRGGTMSLLAANLRARGLAVDYERHDFCIASSGLRVDAPSGVSITLDSTFTAHVDRRRTDNVTLTWKIGDEALPGDVAKLADQITAVVSLLQPQSVSAELQVDVEALRAFLRRTGVV